MGMCSQRLNKGVPSQNQRGKEMGVLIFRVSEGKIHELWSALCDLNLILSLGAIPVLKKDEQPVADNEDIVRK